MKQAGYGRIVTITSQAGKEGIVNTSAYNATKAGVIGFMKSLSKELASFGIRAKTLMGRLCTVNEVASMVASPACSYSTGTCFDVPGGRAQF